MQQFGREFAFPAMSEKAESLKSVEMEIPLPKANAKGNRFP